MQNGDVERFNRTYREDILDAYLFKSLKQVRELRDEWSKDYNSFHPHKSLNRLSPIGYREAVESGKLTPRKCPPEFTTCNSGSNNNNSVIKFLTSNILDPQKSTSDLS